MEEQCKCCKYYGYTFLDNNYVLIGCKCGFHQDFRFGYCRQYKPDYKTYYNLLKSSGMWQDDISEIMANEGY